MKPSLKAQLIAVFTALHLIAIVLQAIPAPGGGMNRSTWKDPTVAGEFKAWSERLNSMGMDLTQKELEDKAWTFAQGYMSARSKVLAPFKPYYKYCGVVQSWRMFVAPHRYPTRLEIAVLEGETWRTVYRERDPEATWRGRWFDQDRFRSVIFRFGWKPFRRTYESFGQWIAGYAAQDFPEATKLRVALYKYRTPSPEEVRAGLPLNGKLTDPLIYPLAKYRVSP